MVYPEPLECLWIRPLLAGRQAHLVSEAPSELDGLRSLDPQALSAIHERYFPELYRYARYRIGDAAAAEDIAAETVVRLLEAVHAGRGPSTSLRGWLMGTVSNLVNDHFRKTYARPGGDVHDNLIDDGPDPSSLLEYRERERSIRSAMAQLTREQQHVLALRFGNGFSVGETAAVMGKTSNAIKALQFRALTALRKEIEDQA